MIIKNNTALNTEIVTKEVLTNRNRLYRSKTGTLQVTIPNGYLTMSLDTDRIGEVYIAVDFEHKPTWRLD